MTPEVMTPEVMTPEVMTPEIPSRYLRCPKCGCHEFWISMTTGGYPAQMTLHCIECNHTDERFWASEDWRDLASLGTFDAPPTSGLVLEERRRGKL